MAEHVAPETYLRFTGERCLLSAERGRPDVGRELAVVGRALIAAGLLDDARVRAVADEYGRALSLRGGHFWLTAGNGLAGRQSLSSRRVVVCDKEFENAGEKMNLGKVVFGEEETVLHLSGTGSGPGRSQQMPRSMPRAAMLQHRMLAMQRMASAGQRQQMAVRDDRGTTATASQGSGSHGGGDWNFRYGTDVPLSADTAFIEIDGTRLDLPAPPPPPEVRIEAAETVEPAWAMLYRELLPSDMHSPGSTLEIAIEALVATGVLEPDDPLLTEVRTIEEVLAGQVVASKLPPPWSALQRRLGKSNGPVGGIPIGALVESVADCSIRFESLASEQHLFTVSVVMSPGWPLFDHFPNFRLEASPIAWWAEDDRNNAYLLAPTGQSGGSDGVAEGELHSTAPLDPKATELRLLPTGPHERAVVVVPLATLGSGS